MLDKWAQKDCREAAYKGALKVEALLKKRWLDGMSLDGKYMEPVAESTMEMPISFSKNKTKRKDANPDRSKPVYATGETLFGVTTVRTPDGAEITNPSAQAQEILKSNAYKSSKTVNKPVRDPMQVGEDAVELVYNAIWNDLKGRI